jgi:hypothetical protein
MDILQVAKISSGSLFAGSIIALIIFIILLIYHYSVKPILPFLPANQSSSYESLPTYQSQTIHASKPVPSNTALNFTSITDFKFEEFTISFDVFINGTYKSTSVPRVLLYFGDAPVVIPSNENFKEYKVNSVDIPSILNGTQTDILTKFNRTNFIVYMDPVKNDLKVGIITSMGTPPSPVLELLPTINNVPINEPFQITIIKAEKFIEVYKNKLLITTYKIKHSPFIINTNSKLYSPISFIGDTIKIGNIQYFNNVITSSQVRSLTLPIKNKMFFTTN